MPTALPTGPAVPLATLIMTRVKSERKREECPTLFFLLIYSLGGAVLCAELGERGTLFIYPRTHSLRDNTPSGKVTMPCSRMMGRIIRIIHICLATLSLFFH